MKIPRHLSHLPVWAGYPVPFFTLIGPDGTPDFRVVDEAKVLKCLRARLCGICGVGLRKTMCFIGGEKSCGSLLFIDPAMHPECARFAAKTCPYLNSADRGFSTAVQKHAKLGVITRETPLIDKTKAPRRMGLVYGSDYNWGVLEGSLVVRAWGVTRIDWKIMPRSK